MDTQDNPFYYFKTNSTYRELVYENIQESVMYSESDDLIASISFSQDDKLMTFKRTYPNILNIFGTISGLVSF